MSDTKLQRWRILSFIQAVIFAPFVRSDPALDKKKLFAEERKKKREAEIEKKAEKKEQKLQAQKQAYFDTILTNTKKLEKEMIAAGLTPLQQNEFSLGIHMIMAIRGLEQYFHLNDEQLALLDIKKKEMILIQSYLRFARYDKVNLSDSVFKYWEGFEDLKSDFKTFLKEFCYVVGPPETETETKPEPEPEFTKDQRRAFAQTLTTVLGKCEEKYLELIWEKRKHSRSIHSVDTEYLKRNGFGF